MTTSIVVYGTSATSNINSISNTSNSFNDIARKLLRANYPSDSKTPPSLEQILEVLLSTHFNTNNTFTEDLLELLITGCHTVNPSDEILAAKFSKIIFTFCNKHLVKLNDTTSEKPPLEIILSFLIQSYFNAHQTDYKVNILRAISQVLYENGQNCQKLHEQLLHILMPLAKENNINLEIRRMAINCLGNLCYRTGNKFRKYKNVYELLLENLHSPNLSNDETAYLKIISSTFRALQFVVSEDKSVLTEPFDPTIEMIKNYVFYNVDDIKRLQAAIDQSQLEVGNSIRNSGPSNQKNSRKHNRMKSIGRSWLSSDSEISDGEHVQSVHKKRNEDSRIRANALGCLQSIARVSTKMMYQYWSHFLPYTEPSETSLPSLFTIIACEPIHTVRISACSAITTMIDGSKQYLAVADDREVKTSFTSLSAKLGAIVRELHAGLLQAISKEDHNIVLVQLLKCCNVLVNNVAYDRLSSDYISRIYYTTANFLVHNEDTVRLAAMTLISTIMDCKTRIKEVDNLLLARVINNISENTTKLPFFQEMNILSYLVLIIGSKDQLPAMRIESWGVLCACARTHFSVVSPEWKHINHLVVTDLVSEDEKIRTAAMTFLVEYAKEQAAFGDNNQNTGGDDERIMIQQIQGTVTPEVFQWWDSVIVQHIQNSSTDKCHAVRALTCDFISHIPSNVFSALPLEKRNYCTKTLLGFSKDESPNVRAAACRGLGVYILFPSLQQDTTFASEMALSVIQQMTDSNVLVKVRSSWALGNLCDTMVLLSNPANQGMSSRNTNLNEFLINVMWARIVKAGLAASNDNEKVRPNGVRTLGSIIHVSPTNFLEREERGLIKDVVNVLIKNFESGTLKVRWNACYAAANMLRNPNFPIGSKSNNWSIPLYEALIRVVRTSKNFKVRINACLALSTPTTRAKYGDTIMLCKILDIIVTSLENVDNLTSTRFSEVKYQDQLRTQLLNTYDHLIDISVINDKRFIESYIQRVNEWRAIRQDYLEKQNTQD